MRPHLLKSEMGSAPGSPGFSLLEALIGVVILGMLLHGALLLSRTSIKSNTRSRDIVSASSILKSFVDEMEGVNIKSIPRNREVIDSVGAYEIRWRAYDNASAVPYRQPKDLLLLCAKVTYKRNGVQFHQETSTFLGRQ
jgi:Tfp pilus assembly protein PilV